MCPAQVQNFKPDILLAFMSKKTIQEKQRECTTSISQLQVFDCKFSSDVKNHGSFELVMLEDCDLTSVSQISLALRVLHFYYGM